MEVRTANGYSVNSRAFVLACALLLSAMATSSAFGQSSASAGSAPPAEASDAQSAQSPGQGDLLTRAALTGDWWGARSSLANHGVSLDLRYTMFYQGLVAGTGDKGFDYGGKVDAFVDLDSGKMGLWKGGGFRSHIEYSHGGLPTNLGGAIFATNLALYFPVDTPEKVVATSLYFTQKLGNRSSISIGKFNPVDVYAFDPAYGGWGIDRFVDLVLAAPPSGLIPVVFMGALVSVPVGSVTWTGIVMDPKDRTNDYFPGDLFQTGVNVALNATRVTTLAGRWTSYGITGLYSTAEGTDYSSVGGAVGTTTKSGSYNVNVQFKHNFQESSEQPNAAWGFFLKAGVGDGNPNYVQRELIVGISGEALFFGRPQDTFGVGVYWYNLSDTLQDALNPAGIKFRDEGAIEAFYSWAVTPWLLVGPDLQYIRPARGNYQNALVAAVRTQIRF